MNRIPITAVLLIILTCFLWNCDGDEVVPQDVDFGYFPLELGSYIVYELDSVVYDDFNNIVKERTLQVREIVESTFIDAGGNESYRIERQYRDDAMDSWGSVGYDIWFASFEGNNAERVEENQRYIKIAFPVRLGKTWLGNIHINVDPDGPLGYLLGWEYEITTLDEALTINGMEFDSTMKIVQHSAGTVIDTVGSQEIYAKGIGLVFKEFYVLESQCNICDPSDIPCIMTCQALPWEERAEKGFIVRHTILEYGNL